MEVISENGTGDGNGVTEEERAAGNDKGAEAAVNKRANGVERKIKEYIEEEKREIGKMIEGLGRERKEFEETKAKFVLELQLLEEKKRYKLPPLFLAFLTMLYTEI